MPPGQRSSGLLAAAEPVGLIETVGKPTPVSVLPETQTGPPEMQMGPMQTHSRRDVISGQWTLFASSRNDRPNDYTMQASGPPPAVDCPFCVGNENQTPPAVVSIQRHSPRSKPGPSDAGLAATGQCACSWSIRVIPNKYPAVGPLPIDLQCLESQCSEPQRSEPVRDGHDGMFNSRPSCGGHEVFIESPSHNATLDQLDLSQVTSLLRVYQDRIRFWSDQPTIQYVSLFKNVGPAAGASLHHPHSQLIALDRLPHAVRVTSDRMRRHHAKTGCCLQCEVLRAELKAKSRIVAVTDSLVAYCPFASHLPMLLRVTTRRHADRFENLGDQELDELARLMRRSIHWLETLYPDGAYNYLFHLKPARLSAHQSFHWSFELFPRLTSLAGFEWSCDTLINPVLPEQAAARFRAVAQQENPMR